MPDPLAGLNGDGAASATAPGPASADIEKIKSELEASLAQTYDERIKGFQRLIAERDSKLGAYERELDELKTSGLSEEEREQLASQKLVRENQQLRGRLEILELAKDYGDEVPVYERLLQATTAEEQLRVLRELRAPSPAQPTQEPEVVIPDTDPNRPLRTPMEGTLLPDGSMMNDAMADRILGSVQYLADVTQRRLRPTD